MDESTKIVAIKSEVPSAADFPVTASEKENDYPQTETTTNEESDSNELINKSSS